MTVKTFSLLVLFILGSAFAESTRPNIVIFLSDDQGWGDLSINGNKDLSNHT
ncbi:hypothetical protein PQO03_01710 [Lentisphaera profundi]|uniref:Sulfatase N-terminal domain-containing protein n=1 Tax=Lentisphaera profundi TaxID=1658616 RepID=A0ABY7VR66_9BACT|nr:hypothetical protein [Lentisphaera profundi]WDE96681.1 hypothetical protein PQO03_01710 [Lentisphaera profundi]